MQFIELSITKTSKPAGRPKAGEDSFMLWSTYDREEKRFNTMQEAKDWIKSEYGNCKRSKMYHDTEEGAEAIGYIYSFNSGWGGEHWHEQHWIEFATVSRTLVKFN